MMIEINGGDIMEFRLLSLVWIFLAFGVIGAFLSIDIFPYNLLFYIPWAIIITIDVINTIKNKKEQ